MKKRTCINFLSMLLAFMLAFNSVNVYAVTNDAGINSDEIAIEEAELDDFALVNEATLVDDTSDVVVLDDAIINELNLESEVEDTQEGEVFYAEAVGVNPIFEGIISEESIKEYAQLDAINQSSDDDAILEASVSDYKGLVKLFKNKAMNRYKGDFGFTYKTDKPLPTTELALQSYMTSLMNDVLTDSPSSITDGDYLRANYVGYKVKLKGVFKNGTYTYTFYETQVITSSSAEEEKEVDVKVDKVLADLNIVLKANDYEKIKALYDYLANNVKYDTPASQVEDPVASGISLTPWSAYGALVKQNCVCQGYAGAMYRLLREAGIDCRYVTGMTPGGAHAWNIVQLGSKYYNLDSTWDSTSGNTHKYFMKCPAEFDGLHLRESMYTTAEFMNDYPMAEKSFNEGDPVPTPAPVSSDTNGIGFDPSKDTSGTIDAKGFTLGKISAKTYTGSSIRPKVTVKYGGKTLKQNVDYILGYENNIEITSKAKVIVYGIGKYKGNTSTEFAIISKPIKKVKAMTSSLPKKLVTVTKSFWRTTYTITYQDACERISVYDGDKLLVHGVDYTLTQTNKNNKKGSFRVDLVGMGSYTGRKTISIPIVKSTVDKTVKSAVLNDIEFGVKPTKDTVVKAVYTTSGNAVPSGSYTVSFKNSKTSGVAYAVIKGKGSYKGTATIPFNIKPLKTTLSVALKSSKPIYADGRPKLPAVKVTATVGGKTVILKKDKDYSVSYDGCIRAGKGTITVTGINSYEGSTATPVTYDILSK